MAIDFQNSRVNTSDITGGSKELARKKPHSDIDLSLAIHPYTGDIRPLKDDRAIRNALKNMLLTDVFERPFQPQLGGNLRGLLFEPMGLLTKLSIEEEIKRTLDKESRVDIIKVNATSNDNKNRYDITIKFKIKESTIIEKLDISLRRLR